MGTHFGEHITIDGYGGSPKRLDSEKTVLSALTELCVLLRMHPLAKPMVVSAPDNHIKDPGGWSGFVIIAESHISIHTFQEKDYCFVDVFSCKDFDVELAANYMIKAFESKSFDKYVVNRGKDFVRHAQPQEAVLA